MAKINKITNMQVGRRTEEQEGRENNWETLDINNLVVPQDKTIFVFGGNTTNRPDSANGNAKIIKALITPENKNKIKIISYSYDKEPIHSNGYFSKEFEESAHMIFEKTFKPMLFDKQGRIKEMKGVEQAFSKVVFVAHCGGTNFINIIIDGLYDTLTQKYPPNTAELLINKIKYFAYAPHQMITHNVNAFIVTPYVDTAFSWAKALDMVETQKVDVDYPKGVIKKLLKAKQQGYFKQEFDAEFKETRAIMFKVGNSTYFIPNRMNPRLNMGDHSIECIARSQFLNSGTDYEQNAKLANFASKLYLNEFLNCNIIDTKKAFNTIAEKIEENQLELQGIA